MTESRTSGGQTLLSVRTREDGESRLSK
jgi:hypothetical protein